MAELWPFEKLDAALATLGAEAPLNGVTVCVLLATGALNPVHRGHVSMLHKAARCLREQYGLRAVGAFLSPSNDLYLAGKFGKGNFIPGEVRAACVDAAVGGDDMVSTGRWEIAQCGHWPDFPDVAKNLNAALQERYGKDHRVMLVYVSGEDHFSRCGLQHGMRGGVGVCVVSRNGRAGLTDVARKVFAVTIVDETSDLSSTKVRQALRELRSVAPSERSALAKEIGLDQSLCEEVLEVLLMHLDGAHASTLAS